MSLKLAIGMFVAINVAAFDDALAKDCGQYAWSPIDRFPGAINGLVGRRVSIVSDPAVAMESSGRLHVFAIGTDGALWHSAQTTDKTGWLALASLGSPTGRLLTGSPKDQRLAAIADRLGLVNVFVVVDGRIWTIRQTTLTEAADSWQPWRRLPVTAPSPPQKIWVGSNEDRRIELFAVHGQALNHTWQMTDGTWFPTFNAFGWPRNAYAQLTVSRDRAGRLVVGAVSVDSAFIRRQVFPNMHWGEWTSVGAPNPGGLGPLVSMALNSDGRLEMLTQQETRDDLRPTEGIYHRQLFHTWQSDENTWSGAWGFLGAPFSSTKWGLLDATITRGREGCLAVNALSSIRSLPEAPELPRVRMSPRYQRQPSSSWNNDWIDRRGAGWGAAVNGRLIVVERSDNYLELFVRGADGSWLHANQLRYGDIVNYP